MQSLEEREASLARSVREKIRRAAKEITCGGRGDNLARLVAAWPCLRPLFPKAVPGQAGLSEAQRSELQGILDSMGGWRGAGASSPDIRRLHGWEAAKVADRIRRLAATLQTDPQVVRASQPGQVLPTLVAPTPPLRRTP